MVAVRLCVCASARACAGRNAWRTGPMGFNTHRAIRESSPSAACTHRTVITGESTV